MTDTAERNRVMKPLVPEVCIELGIQPSSGAEGSIQWTRDIIPTYLACKASDQQGTSDEAREYRPDRTANREEKSTSVDEISQMNLLQGARRVFDENCEKENGRYPRHGR
jgi:hypothetical protein